jgi:hypothetical protein
MSRPIRLAIGAFVLLAAGTLAAEAALAQRARVYHFQLQNLTWFNP